MKTCPACKQPIRGTKRGPVPTLDDAKVRRIYERGESVIAVARMFGVTRQAVYKSLARSWK